MKNNFIVVFIFFVIASTSIYCKNRSPLPKSYHNWMEYFWDEIKDTDIRQIKMPGTHNSGSFSPLNTGWVRNQSYDISGQLNIGVRYFDIRIKKHWNKKYGWTIHHKTHPADNSQSYIKALSDIETFLKRNKKEFVFIKLHITTPESDPNSIINAIQILENKLGSLIYKTSKSFNSISKLTPAMLKKTGKRVILLIENYPLNSSFTSSNDFLQRSYIDDQDANKTITSIRNNLKIRDFTKMFVADAYVWSILGIFNAQTFFHLHYFLPLLKELMITPEMKSAINIIAIDFVNPAIIPLIIFLNLNSSIPNSIKTKSFLKTLSFDFNGDKHQDLLLYRPGSGMVEILKSNGDLSLSKVYPKNNSNNGIGGYNLSSPNDKIITFDYNGDDKDDLLLYNPGLGAVWILKSKGDGSFDPIYTQGHGGLGIGGYDLKSTNDKIVPFDYNGDGKDDLFIYRPGKGIAYILQSLGDGKFNTKYKGNGIGIAGYDLKSSFDKLFPIDYNGDGKDDLIAFRPGKGTVWILKSEGNGLFKATYTGSNVGIGGYDLKSPFDKIVIFDHNGDGKDDLFLYRPGAGAAWVVESKGDGTFKTVYSKATEGIVGYDLKYLNDTVISFDYNGDEKDDLLIYRPGRGAFWVLQSKGNGKFDSIYTEGDGGKGILDFDLKNPYDKVIILKNSSSSSKKDNIILYRLGTSSIYPIKSDGKKGFKKE